MQSLDDLLMEKVMPGDILLFDRRCHLCQTPLAALACLSNQKFLVGDDNNDYNNYGNNAVMGNNSGRFDHVGVVVPHPDKDSMNDPDPEPYLLEYTPQDGIVARPLLERVELSRSRSILLLPLSLPGERRGRGDSSSLDDSNVNLTTQQSELIREKMNERLNNFRANYENMKGIQNMHSTLSLFGSLAYWLGLHEKFSFLPVNPSSFFAVSAMQEAGVALNVEQRAALNAKAEDFLRDHRFQETESVRLRPGFRFMKPFAVRENSN